MKRLSEKLLLLNQTVVDCLGEFDVKKIIQKFTEAGIQVMQADFAFVWFGGVHTEEFELIYKSPTIPYEPSPPRKHGTSRTVLERAKPLLYEDISKSNFVRESARPHMKSLVVIPMQYKEETYGSIFLCFKEIHHFMEEDAELGYFIGNSAAQAITISNLYTQLQDADKKKDNFIAMLAHELRNPLSPLLSAIQILQLKAAHSRAHANATVDSATVEELGALAERQILNMRRILDDLLDVSRITHGKFQLEKRPVNLVDVIHETVKATRPRIAAEKHNLNAHVNNEPITVLGDFVRLEQVLVNLLNNATDYMASEGTIDLMVRQTGDRAVIQVRDQGIGMSHETLTKVFDPFFRADASSERAKTGLGLGLMLCKRIIEMHDGTIIAESKGMNYGSTFTITMPVYSHKAIDEAKNTRPLASTEKKRILIVDDNRAAADTLVQLLLHYGHTVDVVYDAEEALRRLPTIQPEIALLDIGMPGMNGYELAQSLKQRDPSLKLIAVSGYGQEKDRRKSRESGFDHHLIKPVDIRELLKVI